MDGSKFEINDLQGAFAQALVNGASGRPSIGIDPAKYLAFLEDMDAPEEDKLELLSVVAAIVVSFVDMGFGVHPVQLACGELTKELELGDQTDSDGTNHKSQNPFEDTSDPS